MGWEEIATPLVTLQTVRKNELVNNKGYVKYMTGPAM